MSFYYQYVVRDTRDWCFADANGNVALHGHTFREFLRVLCNHAELGAEFQHHLLPQTPAVRHVYFDDVFRLGHLNRHILAINQRLGVDYTPRYLNTQNYTVDNRRDAFDLPPTVLRTEPGHPIDSFFDDQLEQIARALYVDDMRYFESC